ncbi:MAG: hypothetical protein OIF50_01920, partial [Flavobacteriaceae bacterium]|nr:hypothetical protein [Flavobacteriaceae bacterium]
MKNIFIVVFFFYCSTLFIQAQVVHLTATHKYYDDNYVGNLAEAVNANPNKKLRLGGLVFDKTNPNLVYLAVDTNSADNKTGKIIKGEVIRDNSSKIIGFKNWVHYKNAPNITNSSFAFLPNGNILYKGYSSDGISSPRHNQSFYQIAAKEDRIVNEAIYSVEEIGFLGGVVKNPSWHPQPNDYTAFSNDYAAVNMKINNSNNYTYKTIGSFLTKNYGKNTISSIAYVRGNSLPGLQHDPERKGRDVAFFLFGSNSYLAIQYCYINPDGTFDDDNGRKLKVIVEINDNFPNTINNPLQGWHTNLVYDRVSGHLVTLGHWIDNKNNKIKHFGYQYIKIGIGEGSPCNQEITVSSANTSNDCPTATVNLNSLVTSTIPANTTIVWSTDGDPNDGVSNTISNPNAISESGDYFAYYKSDSCGYSKPTKVTVTISSCLDTDGDGV